MLMRCSCVPFHGSPAIYSLTCQIYCLLPPIYGLQEVDELDGCNTEMSGFCQCDTIIIRYDFHGGVQRNGMPEPGHAYSGTSRQAYLPDNKEGREVCKMLKVSRAYIHACTHAYTQNFVVCVCVKLHVVCFVHVYTNTILLHVYASSTFLFMCWFFLCAGACTRAAMCMYVHMQTHAAMCMFLQMRINIVIFTHTLTKRNAHAYLCSACHSCSKFFIWHSSTKLSCVENGFRADTVLCKPKSARPCADQQSGRVCRLRSGAGCCSEWTRP
jgi:hypothetical protein